MHGSELNNDEHSTPEEDPRPKLWPKVLGSLALFGLLVGLMIGRLTEPTPLELLQIEERPTGLALWFNREPEVLPEHTDGMFAMRFTAKGQPWKGQLKVDGKDVRWKLWPKVLGSLALFGLLVGLMIGRLTEPTPLELLQIEERPTGLALWFNREPEVMPEHTDGMFAMRFTAKGQPWKGQLKVNGKDVRWKLERDKRDLLLTLLAARPLHGDLHGEKLDGRWRLEVSLREE